MKQFVIGFVVALVLCLTVIYFLSPDHVPAQTGRVMENPIAIEFEKSSNAEKSSESRKGIIIIPSQPMSAIE